MASNKSKTSQDGPIIASRIILVLKMVVNSFQFLPISKYSRSSRSLSDESTHSHSNKLHNPSQLIAQKRYQQHPWWEHTRNWKSTLNNVRFIIQPYIFYSLIRSWLEVFEMTHTRRGLCKLIYYINDFRTVFNARLVTDLVVAQFYTIPEVTKEY